MKKVIQCLFFLNDLLITNGKMLSMDTADNMFVKLMFDYFYSGDVAELPKVTPSLTETTARSSLPESNHILQDYS